MVLLNEITIYITPKVKFKYSNRFTNKDNVRRKKVDTGIL